ncbi:MAG: DNA primase [Bacteroidales bacterium]|nr:DNA primase [Bacteroidales bacterium]
MAQYLNKSFVDKIVERSNADSSLLLQVVSDFCGDAKKEGASYKFVCPVCGSHTLLVTPGKQIFKCFGCNEVSGRNALNFLTGPGIGKDFVDAVKYVADCYHEYIEYEEPYRPEVPKNDKGKSLSFCERMLRSSGLDSKDVTAYVFAEDNDNTRRKVPTFVKGSVNSHFEVDAHGDDMIIRYYDLEGRPRKYTVTPKGGKPVERTYFRVRFQFPDANLDKNGRPIKYKSPVGAPTFIYYPESIRTAYKEKRQISTLFVQEGEKKAEKACKHGLASVAISGIQNFGYKGELPKDFIQLVDTCQVKEVIFLLDSDLHDLSQGLNEKDPVEKRPQNFFYAVRNFREYISGLRNQQLEVEVYYGHILKNEKQDKGVDDLLANTLKGREEELLQDIEKARNEKQHLGVYVQLYKITTATDAQLRDQFYLQSAQVFCEHYFEELKHLRKFICKGREWTFNEKGQLENAQPVQPEEQFWQISESGNGKKTTYEFWYVGALRFLQNRGFYRFLKTNEEYDFIKVEKSIVKVVPLYHLSDYIYEFAKDCCPVAVQNMLIKGGAQYLGPLQLGHLEFFKPDFWTPQRGEQYLYFANQYWHITDTSIDAHGYEDLHHNIWKEQRHEHTVQKLPPLISIRLDDQGRYHYSLTTTGQKCDFLQFLVNASNFTWRKETVSEDEELDQAQHLVSKLAAFGYLITSAKDKSVCKAVVAMDGKQADFGESNGRSGKSLLGEAVRQVISTKQLNGKAAGAAGANNQFIWDGVDEKTRLVFIDDVQKDFNFELIFSLITGDFAVNPKGTRAFTLPFATSPKFYISTNYAIAGEGESFAARQWLLAFSDYYNSVHQPKDDFKVHFFDEWDEDQWNLFWNFAAQCVQIYFRYGYVPAPDDRLEERKLTQAIGEDFLSWADQFYSEAGDNINRRLERAAVYKDFIEKLTASGGAARVKFYNPNQFGKRIELYCRLRKLIFNPHKYDPVKKEYIEKDKDDKPKRRDISNSVEYYTLGTMAFYYGSTPAPLFSNTAEVNCSTEGESEPEPYER